MGSDGTTKFYEHSSLDQSEADLAIFLQPKTQNGQKVEIDFDQLLGIGGESLVLKKCHAQTDKAFKIIPRDGESSQTKNLIQEFHQKMNSNISENQFAKSAEEAKNSQILVGRAEYECASVRHENVINYENVTMDLVDGHICLVAGNF